MQKIIAIDTEFERKHTYKPILSLVQVKKEEKDVELFDILCDKKDKLFKLIDLIINDENIKIIHSARQDVEAIYYHFHIEMHNIFDTQIAEKCLYNKNEIGYAELIKKYCNKIIQKDKQIQNSDWLKRPLTEKQKIYAKQDVEFLHDIYYKMIDILNRQENNDVYKKFKLECSLLENSKNYFFNPILCWNKHRSKFINVVNQKLIKELFILREKIAYSIDVPRERVVSCEDMILFSKTGNIDDLYAHKKVNKKEFLKFYYKYN